MANNGARVHIYGDWDGSGVKKAQQDIGLFEKQADGFSKSFSKSMLGAGAAIGAAFAIGNIVSGAVGYLKDAAQAAIQDEKSMVALKTAMDNVGQGFANSGAEKFIKDLMLATGVADDELRPAFQRLVTATGDAAKSQELLKTALDVSAATGKDLVTVSTAISKAATGNIGALSRLGIPLDANIIKTKDFSAAVGVLNEKFGGQAAAAAATYGGQLKRLETAAGEAQETVGYALLNAIEDVTNVFGGTNGAVGVVTSMGDALAGMVTQAGDAATEVAKLASGLSELSKPVEEQAFWAKSLSMIWHILSTDLTQLGMEVVQGTTLIDEQTDSVQASQKALDAVSSRYRGLVTVMAPAKAVTLGLMEATEEAAQKFTAAKVALQGLQDVLDNSQSLDDFKKSLADLDETLKKNPRSFKGMGDAAKENRDVLRQALGDAADIAQKWVDSGKIAADQYDTAYRGLAKKVVNQFVKDGFKRSDVTAFLGGEGIWMGASRDALSAAERAALQKAYPGFKNAGTQAAAGFAAGLNGPAGLASAGAAAVALANHAKRAAEAALEIQSPSKVFMEIGRQTVAGFVEGMASKDKDVREQARKTMTEAVNQVISDTRDKLKQALTDAKAAFREFQSGVSDAIMGGINFADAAPEFDDAGNRVGSTFIEALRKQAAQAVQFATQVKTLISQGLSKEALQQVLAAGTTAGSAIATELIAGGTTAINETNQLVASTQAAADKVGLQAATKWYGAGVTSARQTVQAFNDEMKPGGPGYERLMNRMDRLAESLNRTARITVVVDEVAGAKVKVSGARANGGPVWPGGAFIVGERGPELFMPDVKGQILPSASMPSAGGASPPAGNTYAITVNTGVGDPRVIGQEIVQYIKRFERSSGPVFAAAS